VEVCDVDGCSEPTSTGRSAEETGTGGGKLLPEEVGSAHPIGMAARAKMIQPGRDMGTIVPERLGEARRVCGMGARAGTMDGMRTRVTHVIPAAMIAATLLSWTFWQNSEIGMLSRSALEKGELWVFLTYAPIHVDWWNLTTNLVALISVSAVNRGAGYLLSRAREWFVFVLGVTVGGVGHVLLDAEHGVVGTSAGVIALITAVSVALLAKPSQRWDVWVLRVVMCVVLTTAMLPGAADVSSVSHIGGFLAGVVGAMARPPWRHLVRN